MSKSLRQMVQHDATGGILLVVMAMAALIIANTPMNTVYSSFLSLPVQVRLGDFNIDKPLVLWVNDGLMALFFFLIGMEVKRELLVGNLRSKDQIILPAVGAVAGIVFPALVYMAFNGGDSLAMKGWAIPSATDIAFALGIFSLFGRGLPISLKLFLLSVAIFDDIGAIIIIALFYSQDLATSSLLVAGAGLIGLFLLNRFSVKYLSAYLLIGLIVWASVLKSGVHATLAGFLVAWFIPLNVKDEDGRPMLPQVEHGLQPWIAFFVLPIFAFANAGVELGGMTINDIAHPVTLGIALGLFVGKQIGVFGVCWVLIKLGWAKLPKNSSWLQFYAISLLCGIGFTMSLFIGGLAFENSPEKNMSHVKMGVLLGSLASAVLGAAIIQYCKNSIREKEKCKSKYAV